MHALWLESMENYHILIQADLWMAQTHRNEILGSWIGSEPWPAKVLAKGKGNTEWV
jgi:hypothetical protein